MQRGWVYMIKQRFKLQPIKNTLCGCRMLILPTCIITNCTASTLYCLVFLEVKKHPVECLPKRFPHYTLAQLGAYLCSFFLADPNSSSSLFSDWLSPSSVLSCPVLPAALGILLTSGCATSRHCQQQELPGVRIHCCDSDLCNNAPSWRPRTIHCVCALFSLLLLRMWLWYIPGGEQHKGHWTTDGTLWTRKLSLAVHT